MTQTKITALINFNVLRQFTLAVITSRSTRVKYSLSLFNMWLIKVATFLVLSWIFCLLNAKSLDYQDMYIKAVNCNVSDKYVYKNCSCFAKSYSRSVSTMNIIGTAKMPLNNITVSQVFKFIRSFYIHSFLFIIWFFD